MRVCVSACVCVSFNQVEAALHMHYFIFQSIIYVPFTIDCYVKIRGMNHSAVWKPKMKSLMYEVVNTCTLCIRCISVYNPINVIVIRCTNDTCFAIHELFAITTSPV